MERLLVKLHELPVIPAISDEFGIVMPHIPAIDRPMVAVWDESPGLRSFKRNPQVPAAEQRARDGQKYNKMIGSNAWLTSGTAVVDAHGRIVESNEEFAAWAASASPPVTNLLELIGGKWPGWVEKFEKLLTGTELFESGLISDDSVVPPQWYSYELTRAGELRVLRLCRALPPLDELTECAWDKYLDDENSRRELYSRTLRAEGQLKLLGGKWPGVLFNQRPDFTFSFVSQKIDEWTGIIGAEWNRRPQRFWDVVHEADFSELQAQIARCKTGEAVTFTYRLRHAQTGRVTYIMERREAILSNNGLVLGYDGAWIDVTRQTIAEKRLASAVWKETLGVLTMGLAHDFSNILAGISSLSEMYQTSCDAGSGLHETFGLIKRNALQATQLVQRVLSLHHGKVGDRNYYDANELLVDTLEIIRKPLRRIQVQTQLCPEPLPLYVDPIELRQVLVNLALNASDAMSDGGELTFTSAIYEELPPFGAHQGVTPRLPAICITVRDDGCGIAPEHLHDIFDPFFTTKPLNKGSGLGLYNARLFVDKHRGAISVESSDGNGATFRIWLPKANFNESDRAQGELVLGRKTLLLVEPSGRHLEGPARSLRENGFYVATAASERSAIELLHAPDYQFDAILALLNGHGQLTPRLFNEVGRLKLPIKTILQIYGANEDEHDPLLIERADFVISSDIPANEIPRKVREVLSKF